MTFDFAGRTVVVTGGGHGLGREMCRTFNGLGPRGSVYRLNPVSGHLEPPAAFHYA